MKGVVALGLVVIVSIAVMHVNADSSEKMNKYHKRTGHYLIHSLKLNDYHVRTLFS
jgi:hypothetical protein